MLRDIGTVPPALLDANLVDWWYAVRIDIASPVGTRRFTDCPRGDFTANVDGTSQTWTAVDVRVGKLDQGQGAALSVSEISFANLDYTWTNWANSPGLRDAPVQIYRVWFDAAGAFSGAPKLYEGRLDNHWCGARAKFALKPWRAKWARRALTQVPGVSNLLPAPLMPKDDEPIYWGSVARRS